MAQTTPHKIIKQAMRVAGIISRQKEPSSKDMSDGLDALNDMLESWSTESLLVRSRVHEGFDLTGAREYTIGEGADFDTAPPVDLIKAYVTQGTIDYPVSIINDDVYAHISYKDTRSIPEYLVYNNAYPTGTIRLFPIPDGRMQLHLISEKSLYNFANINQQADLPPGWARALKYNLAIELLPGYDEMEATPALIENARKSKAAIKRQVIKNRSIAAYPQARATQNIYTGWYH